MLKKAEPGRTLADTTAGRMRLSVASAVHAVLYGLPLAVSAQQTTPSKLEEVTVTASRRSQAAEEVPYSLSVISADTLASTGVVDIQTLAVQVPGLSMFDFGARDAGAVAPIIRGLNATGEPRGFRTFEQDPVGTYVGNSPMSGYFQLEDLKQVEILRGPQGTLYGAGALGGALRFIPNAPELDRFSAQLGAGAAATAHSSGTGYTLNGLVNFPLGSTVAFRASAKYEYEPGFIHLNGLIERSPPYLTGTPILANPADPVNSSAVLTQKADWNDQKTLTGRAALRWQPAAAFSAELAYLYSHLQGDGGPQANPDVAAGAYPLDPRITLPAAAPYTDFSPSDQPYKRSTGLLSLDLSYDVGFATVSSTSSYYHTGGATSGDDTYHFASFPAYLNYYAGSPTNPRYLEIQEFDDDAHVLTQEVRLVSNAGREHSVDYTVGVYYEHAIRHGFWDVVEPGTYERAVAQHCTGYYYLGAQFPNCLLNFAPNRNTSFFQEDRQHFHDTSEFGELTWHFNARGQITFGGRHFRQDFTDSQAYLDYPFKIFLPGVPHDAPSSKNTWKINPSYQYADKQYLYAAWSQGFRRGGANSVPLVGFYKESPLLQEYAPDSVNNYELGLKGRLSNGFTYTAAVFDVEWDHPQISASLPSGNLAVYNGDRARSRGIEAESAGPLFSDHLTYGVGFAVAQAQLTQDFSLPANIAGQIVPGAVKGFAGEQLPGSPKFSSSATVNYQRDVEPGYLLTLSLNHTYRTHAPMGLAAADGSNTLGNSSAYGLLNFSTSLAHGGWMVRLRINNLLDKRAVLAPSDRIGFLSNLTDDHQINRPRVVGLTMLYDLG